jgi:dihydroflavonol-4-reductase
MRCLITGASGLVGANLVELAAQRGWRVRAMHRKSSNLKALAGLSYETALGDVTEPESLVAAMRDIDVVFHVAAVATYWKADVQWMYHVNVEGTRNVLRAAQAANVKRVVHTSSTSVLGQPPFGLALDESAHFNLRPQQFYYGHSKHLAEQAVAEFVRAGLDVVIVNPGVIMGPRDVNVIGGAVILETAKIGVPFIPPGGVNMVDVTDVCEGHLSAALCGRTGQRYILGGENLWHKQVFDVTADVVGRPRGWLKMPRSWLYAAAGPADFLRNRFKLKLPVNGEQIRFSAETFWANSAKARAELNFTTRPFAETVQRTFAWYRDNNYL